MSEINKRGVRAIVLIGGLIAAIVPALILGAVSGVSFRNLVINDNTQRATELSHALAERFDQIQEDQSHIVAIVSRELGPIDNGDHAAVTAVLQKAVGEMPFAFRLTYLDATGKVIGWSQTLANTPLPDITGTDLHDRIYFQDALSTRRTVLDDTPSSAQTGQSRGVVVAGPVLDAAGNVKGVLSEVLDFRALQKEASDIKLGTNSAVLIADAQGNLIVAPNSTGIKTRPSIANLPFWNRMVSANEGSLGEYVDPIGVLRLGGFSTVASSGWKIWLGRSMAEVDDQVVAVFERVAVWVVLAVALAALAAWLLARSISRPVEALRETAAAIAAGDLSARAPEEGPADVVVLARAVNRMAVAIKERVEAEQQNRQRLQAAVRDYGGFAERVAAGDLAARAGSSGDLDLDLLGGGLNRMTESLARLVGEIQGAVARVESSASEIMAATSQQVAATSEQATAVRQTATTVAEVRQTSEVAARKTRDVAELAQQIESTAEGGRRSVDDSVRGSDEAKERIEALAQRILVFSDQAQEIAEINATVGDLAEQSNLLAVNASIEAAKAGEAGRGFGVVASEIKELADRCKEATGQVRRIVTEIQRSAQAAVMAAEQGVKMAGEVSAVARRSGGAIAALSDSIVQASQAARQISASAEQQEVGMDQIVLSMRNIEQASGQNVAATQQVERAAKDLTALARALADLVRATRLDPTA